MKWCIPVIQAFPDIRVTLASKSPMLVVSTSRASNVVPKGLALI